MSWSASDGSDHREGNKDGDGDDHTRVYHVSKPSARGEQSQVKQKQRDLRKADTES